MFVTRFTASIAVLYDFLNFWNSLLCLIFLVVVFITCTAFLIVWGISWIHAVMFSSRVLIIIAIAIIT